MAQDPSTQVRPRRWSARTLLACALLVALSCLLVIQLGCPLVTHGTSPEAECGLPAMQQLLAELSASFSEGFSLDDARAAGKRIAALSNKHGGEFRYGPVVYHGGRYEDFSFYIHKRSDERLWLSLYCHESPQLRPRIEEEVRAIARRLCGN